MAGRKSRSGDGQLSLTGFGAAVKPSRIQLKHRLFLGIFADSKARAPIATIAQSLAHEHGMRGRPLPSDRLHVTLHHLGDYLELPPERVDAAMAAIGRIDVPAFDIEFVRIDSFHGKPGHYPCVLRCADAPAEGDAPTGIFALWHEARVQLAAEGYASMLGRRFVPHLTLVYGDRRLPAPVAIQPIAWRVDEVMLVHSLLGRTEYRFLARRPLAVAHDPDR
jgi:2'-5' RNA ligase